MSTKLKETYKKEMKSHHRFTTLARIRDLWEKVPDLRLGQLLSNTMLNNAIDLFHIEDNKLVETIEEFVRRQTNE